MRDFYTHIENTLNPNILNVNLMMTDIVVNYLK